MTQTRERERGKNQKLSDHGLKAWKMIELRKRREKKKIFSLFYALFIPFE
jgi:hypothetical protein